MCFGPGAQLLIPPSHEALRIGAYVKASLSLIGALMVVRFIGGPLYYGLIDVFIIFFGLMTFRSQEGWGLRQIACLNILAFIMTFFYAFECIMFLVDNGKYRIPLWMWYFTVGGILAAPLFYACLAYFSSRLLREMKRVHVELINEMVGELGGEDSINQPINIDQSGNIPQPFGFGNYFGRQSEQPVEPAIAPVAPEEPPVQSQSANSNSSFTPYTGQGHKLGDTVV